MTTKPKRGRWKTGQSGNPRGRPPGLGEVTRLRQGIAGHLPEIIQTLVVQAKGGDCQAARLLLERCIPVLKPVEMPIALPLPDDGDASTIGRVILAAMASGEIAPGQAASLLTALAASRRAEQPTPPIPAPPIFNVSFISPTPVADAERIGPLLELASEQ